MRKRVSEGASDYRYLTLSLTIVQYVRCYCIAHRACASVAGDNTVQRHGCKEDQQRRKKHHLQEGISIPK